MTEKKYGGIIQRWIHVGNVVVGELFNDPNKRFKEGDVIRTSLVLSIDKTNGKLETQNTIYDLGEEDNEWQ